MTTEFLEPRPGDTGVSKFYNVDIEAVAEAMQDNDPLRAVAILSQCIDTRWSPFTLMLSLEGALGGVCGSVCVGDSNDTARYNRIADKFGNELEQLSGVPHDTPDITTRQATKRFLVCLELALQHLEEYGP